MSDTPADKIHIPWDTEAACELDNKAVDTRLDQYPDEEYAGPLFENKCPNLDLSIPKKNDRFIDLCPIDIPDIPKAVLKLTNFPEVPFLGVPTAEIPKALLSHLLPCCLKGRTAGFDFDIERELYSNGKPVVTDPDEALLPISIKFGDRGTLKLGIDIKAESCFCDESCGPEDKLKLKFSTGAKYIPNPVDEVHQDISDPYPSVVIDEENLTQLFYTTKPPGSLAQIVAYEPEEPSAMGRKQFHKIKESTYYYCKTEVWHAAGPAATVPLTPDSGCSTNRWKYKIRLLKYDATNAPEVVVGNEQDTMISDMVFPAYNLNEYSANSDMLPTGISSHYPWYTTFYSIQGKIQAKGGSRALPCPVGSIVYVIDTTPLEYCKNSAVEDCVDCIPPLLFYKQNRDVPLKKQFSIGKFIRFAERTGWITVKPSELANGLIAASVFKNSCVDTSDPHAINTEGEMNIKIPQSLLQKYRVKPSEYHIPEFDSAMCYTDDAGITWGIPIETSKRYTIVRGGKHLDEGTWEATGNGIDNRKIIARCKGGLKFEEVSLAGQAALNAPVIEAQLPPYIQEVKKGGYYILEWFDAYDSWVVTGGQCPEDVADYLTVDDNISIQQHVYQDGGTIKTNQPVSGSIHVDVHDNYSRLESSTLQGVYDLYGYEGKSSSLFQVEPRFTYDKSAGNINYEGLVLRPGAAGYAVYTFVITECNGSDRHVYTYGFTCIETNDAPIVSLDNTDLEVHSGEELSKVMVGTASDSKNDPLTVQSDLITGKNLLDSYKVELNSSGDILVSAKAKNGVVGTAIIEFRVDDAHNFKSNTGTYDYHSVQINVVNHAPTVNIPDNVIRLNLKSGITRLITIGTIQDEDNDTQFQLGDVYMDDPSNAIDQLELSVKNTTLRANVRLSEDSAGTAIVYFKIHDKHKVYSDMPEQQYQSFTLISENAPPKVTLTKSDIDVEGLEEQEFTIGHVSDEDGDSQFFAKITKIEGPKCYESISLDMDGSSIKLKVYPSRTTSGYIYLYFIVDDNRKGYTKSEPQEKCIKVTCGNTPPTFTQTVESLAIPNGETVTKTIGTLSDTDGDTEFTPVIISKDNPDNVIVGEMFIEDNVVKITITGMEGRIGEEVVKFTFDDARGNYDRGNQEEYELTIRVL